MDQAPGTSTVMIEKGNKGVWYGVHDDCLRAAVHPSAPLSPLDD